MKYARVDANHHVIVNALRQAGCTVTSLAAVGKGVPDLLVGIRGRNYLIEIKDGSKPPSERKLTSDQIAWHESWRGAVRVVENEQQALEVINDF